MTKRILSCKEIELPHQEMVQLRHAGKLKLGISDSTVMKVIQHKIGPSGTAIHAHYFWLLVVFGILGLSVYWSITSSWWWFIAGLILAAIVVKATNEANRQNFLDAAMIDAGFYERVRFINGWLYEIDDEALASLNEKHPELDEHPQGSSTQAVSQWAIAILGVLACLYALHWPTHREQALAEATCASSIKSPMCMFLPTSIHASSNR